MHRAFPYRKLGKYPHLSRYEAALWERFIALNPEQFNSVFYDVTVGDRREDKSELAEPWERNADYLGSYKIDVVGEDDNAFTVVELKREATTKAMGEIWLYDELFKEKYDIQKPVLNMVITDVEMPNIRQILEKEGVELVVVGTVTQTDEKPGDPTRRSDQEQDQENGPDADTNDQNSEQET